MYTTSGSSSAARQLENILEDELDVILVEFFAQIAIV